MHNPRQSWHWNARAGDASQSVSRLGQVYNVAETPRLSLTDVTQENLTDRWYSRDLPVLLEIARLFDQGTYPVDADTLPGLDQITTEDVNAALEALIDVYVLGQRSPAVDNREEIS